MTGFCPQADESTVKAGGAGALPILRHRHWAVGNPLPMRTPPCSRNSPTSRGMEVRGRVATNGRASMPGRGRLRLYPASQRKSRRSGNGIGHDLDILLSRRPGRPICSRPSQSRKTPLSPRSVGATNDDHPGEEQELSQRTANVGDLAEVTEDVRPWDGWFRKGRQVRGLVMSISQGSGCHTWWSASRRIPTFV